MNTLHPNTGNHKKNWLRARIGEGVTERTAKVTGREAWALDQMVAAGAKGVTPITHPGPRWSAYVYDLRHDHGIEIETRNEPHGGPFAGTHARYFLKSPVTIVERSASEGAAA